MISSNQSLSNAGAISTGYQMQFLHSDTNDQNIIDELERFVARQQDSHADHPAIANMLGSTPQGFLYLVRNQQRWRKDQGQIGILRHQKLIIGVSCVEHGNLHQSLSIGGVRCWLDRQHRSKNLMSRFLLDSNIQWSQQHGKIGMLLTFNDYNKWIYTAALRPQHGRAAGISSVWSNWWKDIMVIKNPLMVRNVPQWCVCKPISMPSEVTPVIEKLGQDARLSSV
jgi:hypothetical protein